jgi:phage terminase small subunit
MGKKTRLNRVLTQQQEKFCEAYALNGNGAEAYLAGYPASAKHKPQYRAKKGNLLLNKGDIRGRIEVLQGRIKEVAEHKFDVTVEKVVQELAAIAFANVGDYHDWGPSEIDKRNGGFARVKSSHQLSRTQKAAIVGVEVSFTKAGDTVVSVKMGDKRAALKDLGQFLKIFNQSVEHTGASGGPIVQELHVPDVRKMTSLEALKEFDAFRAQLALAYARG